MAKTITVIIDKAGETKIEMDGFSGTECLKESKTLEDALGKAEKRTMKDGSKPVTIADQTKIGG